MFSFLDGVRARGCGKVFPFTVDMRDPSRTRLLGRGAARRSRPSRRRARRLPTRT